jgi:F-type H+-transporting ATPase subunit b
VPATDPKTKAQSLIDALPGSSLISKSAILSSAAGLSVYAISNEYYVLNEESIVALALLTMWISVFRYGGPMYSSWAEGQNEKIKGILNAARADHTQAVKTRIENVQQMAGVVDVTKSLFEVSKVCTRSTHMDDPPWLTSRQETAKIEAQVFELEQKTAIAAEARSVLDSWVRYESQVKQRQQRELADTIIAKVQKELENPKVLQQILQQSIQDVESECILQLWLT